MIPKVENNMRIVQQQRARYIEQNPDEFNHEEEKTAYIKDYVAKYEISDLMQILGSDLENLVFLRHVGYEFPELVADLKHEEKKRLESEELNFKGEKLIIESFYQEKKLQTLQEWGASNILKGLRTKNKPLVLIGDLLGHYVVFVACRVTRRKDQLFSEEDTLFLLNSDRDDYISFEDIISEINKLAFPQE